VILDVSGATLPRHIAVNGQTVFQNYITVEEQHQDESIITLHPVEQGAMMSDHIYLQPPQVTLRLGWSNSDAAATGPTYVRDVYAALLQLKTNRQLAAVWTGKRYYTNMSVKSLHGPRTDSRFEFAMIVDVMLQQLLLVNSSSPTAGPSPVNAAANSSPAAQADPTKTSTAASVGDANTSAQNVDQTTPNPSPPIIPGFNDAEVQAPTEVPVGAPNSNGGGAGPAPFIGAIL
jgi:hypothetical protein